MIWNWLTERRRRAIVAEPFPREWDAIVNANVAHWRYLSDEERQSLRQLVQVFVAEKSWEGCGGLDLTDEIKVTIAAEACLLLLGRDHSLFANVDSILVYPHTVKRPSRPSPIFSRNPETPDEGPAALLGEAHLGGPVILVWDAVKRGARHPEDGHNVVFHEFAHMIDMLDGGADGTPPLETRAAVRTWARVAEAAFLELQRRSKRGMRSFLDAYGAKNEAEFFAVATEGFFERPEDMQRAEPDLYEILKEFYAQDPAARVRRFDAEQPNGPS